MLTTFRPSPHPRTDRPARRLRATTALVGVGLLALAGCGQTDQQAPEQGDEQAEQQGSEPMDQQTDQQTDSQTAPGGATGTAAPGAGASAMVHDVDGNELGVVEFTEAPDGLQVSADLSGLEPGFYGFHLHQTGECEPDSAAPDDPSTTGAFLSAGSHIGADESEHPDHAGDLPPLLVTEAGTAELSVVTDRLTTDELLDDDGTAVMVHSQPDNFANIPERYAPEGPDSDTTGTGDAGDRLACGVVE